MKKTKSIIGADYNMQIEEEERHQGAGTSRRLYCAPFPEIHFQRLRNTSCDKQQMGFTKHRFLKIFISLPTCNTTVNVVFVMSHCTSTFEYARLKFINAKDQSILVARAKSSKVFVAA